ncbi:MAG: hypothetical protein PHX25_01015 [Candidatus Pacebacteria bacterium]|nr:hypothetical protein [Candidatus Paceibacterota bacterium]
MNKKEFYIEKIGQRGKIKIYTVDGFIVRRDLDEEFVNFGQHFRYKCIPEYEFWLDKEATPDERKFYIDHLLVEWKMMKGGALYKDACVRADEKERTERKRTETKNNIHLKQIGEAKGKIKIWIINGKAVRDSRDIDFTEGGHDYVYSYVPKNEVWIDNDITEEERPFVILHELFERSLMKKGMGYGDAHVKASEIEWKARHDGEKLRKSLKKLGYEISG